MTVQLPADLAAYLAEMDRQHASAVNRVFDTLTPYEQRLIREVAVMGYVRGHIAGRCGADIPKDSATVYEVIDACIAMDDLYPLIAAASRSIRPDTEENSR